MKWLQDRLSSPLNIEEIKLIAWHHMINDPYLSTYIMVDGKEVRTYVNPKLAFNRMLGELGDHFQEMAQTILDTFMPSFAQMSEAFQEFSKSFEQLGLIPSLEDENPVESY